MKIVLQRVLKAEVEIAGKIIGQIDHGYLIFLGVGERDTEKDAEYLAQKVSNLRIMPDKNDKMNLTLKDVSGSVLVISQFTLYGDTKGQNRPSFIEAAKPEKAEKLYNYFVDELKKYNIPVQTGLFAAKMEVNLVNDGPVTLILDTKTL